jgi:hypothetical protein
MNYMPILHTSLAIRMSALSNEQAVKNHSQTLNRLAERGGVSPDEAVALMEERRWESMSRAEALKRLAGIDD